MTGGPDGSAGSGPAGAAADEARARVEDVARTSYGRLVAYLASTTRDIAAAEDALSAAFVAALATWPERGVPQRPDAWLLTAARRSLVDASRRRDTARRALPDLARLVEAGSGTGEGSVVPDVRLQLMFACTHPAVDPAVRSPLMLQTVLGLDAVRIGAVFLVPATTMGQRLVRAKTKIKRAGVPFAVPPDDELPGRVGAVLDAVYAAYTAGWDDPAGGGTDGTDGSGAGGLVEESLRLARLVVQLLPADPEAAGLLALLLHSHARRDARRDARGGFVPLAQQDTARWSAPLMAEAEGHLSRAAAARRPGPYQLMAAVQSVHNRRALTGTTDHAAVAQLYDGLAALTPTVGVLVARAAATLADGRPAEALHRLDALAPAAVAGYQPYWATRAVVLDALGDPGAGAARATAADLAADLAVRAHLGGGPG